ncbi:MAG: class I SAM-dependent methyltransferase [Verrucomicrobia bacterium]|nr:class I SAM-dependent methyltransferase [Verrucomicrobiota bacterium]
MNLAELHRSHDQANASWHGRDNYQVRTVRNLIHHFLNSSFPHPPKNPTPPSIPRILDVGCADGYILSPFTATTSIIGVDVSPQFAPLALKAGFASHQIKDLSSDPIDVPSASIDLVFCGQTIEHVVDTDWLLSEINRALKPGGTFIVTTPNIRSPHSLVRLLLNEPPAFGSKYRSGHVRDWTTRMLRRALENNGFSVSQARGVEFWLPGGSDFLSPLTRFLPSLSTAMLLAARKTSEASYSHGSFEN